MPGVMDSVSTVNSLIRTLLAVVAVGGGRSRRLVWILHVYVRWPGTEGQRTSVNRSPKPDRVERPIVEEKQAALAKKDEEISDLNVEIKQQELQIQKLDTSLRLLKVNHRLAWLTVLDQGTDPETNETFTEVQFVEVDKKRKGARRGQAVSDSRRPRLHRQLGGQV